MVSKIIKHLVTIEACNLIRRVKGREKRHKNWQTKREKLCSTEDILINTTNIETHTNTNAQIHTSTGMAVYSIAKCKILNTQ